MSRFICVATIITSFRTVRNQRRIDYDYDDYYLRVSAEQIVLCCEFDVARAIIELCDEPQRRLLLLRVLSVKKQQRLLLKGMAVMEYHGSYYYEFYTVRNQRYPNKRLLLTRFRGRISTDAMIITVISDYIITSLLPDCKKRKRINETQFRPSR